VHLGSLFCGLWWFVVASLPPPPRLLSCGVLAQFCCFTGPFLWYLVASCDGLVALPSCLECCGTLLPRFILLHGSKGCVGSLIHPLHHGAYVVVGLCAPSSGTPPDTAKLRTRYSLLRA